MALIQIQNNLHYQAISTDISSNKIAGLSSDYAVGAKVYLTDLKIWKIVNPDYTLSDYVINSDLLVSDLQIGAVELKDSTTSNRLKITPSGTLISENVILSGVATGGSKSTIVDTSKNFQNDILIDKYAEIVIGSTTYMRKITDNTADTITINTIAGSAASASIGSGENGVVTVTSANDGIGGNSYTLQALLGDGVDIPMSVLLTGLNLVVTLGTNGGGTIDMAKNTAILIASAIDTLEQFTATHSGTGADTVNGTMVINFTGGVAVVACSTGNVYNIKSI